MNLGPVAFLDRSLGRIRVPGLLRSAGIELITLAEHYGIPQDEQIEDTEWIADASARGWILFMKDERIRRRPAELAAIRTSQARCFCLSSGNLPAEEMAARYVRSFSAIMRVSERPGPYVYAVRSSSIEELALGGPHGRAQS